MQRTARCVRSTICRQVQRAVLSPAHGIAYTIGYLYMRDLLTFCRDNLGARVCVSS
jgi:hypothetical protein